MSTTDPLLFPDDEHNPYAPPRSDPRPELARSGMSTIPPRIDDIVARTWRIYGERMGLCIGVVLLYLVLMFGMATASAAMTEAVKDSQEVTKAVAVLANLGLMLFVLWITLGLVTVMLDIAWGRATTISGLFDGGRYLLRMILASLLFALAMVGTAALGAGLGAGMAGVAMSAVHGNVALGIVVFAVGAICGYIAAIILSLRLSQYLYVILDRDAGVLDSLRISFEMTRGHVGLLFALSLFSGLIHLGGMLTCGIGLIFTMPFVMLMFVVAYLALTGQSTADPYGKDEPLDELELV